MPEKQKNYARVIFPPEVLMEADHLSMTLLKDKDPKLTLRVLEVDGANEKWAHDDEAEFFADYRKEFRNATFRKGYARTTDLIVNVALNYVFLANLTT